MITFVYLSKPRRKMAYANTSVFAPILVWQMQNIADAEHCSQHNLWFLIKNSARLLIVSKCVIGDIPNARKRQMFTSRYEDLASSDVTVQRGFMLEGRLTLLIVHPHIDRPKWMAPSWHQPHQAPNPQCLLCVWLIPLHVRDGSSALDQSWVVRQSSASAFSALAQQPLP